MTYVKAECVLCAKFKGCDKSSPDITECADYRQTNEQTNEEWIKSCSTEELAEFLNMIEYAEEEITEDELDAKKCWVKWLQEKHTE